MWTVVGVVVAGVCLCAGILALGGRYEKQARPRAARWTRQAFGPAVGLTVFVAMGVFRDTGAKMLALQVAIGAAGGILGALTAVLQMRRKERRQMEQLGRDPDQPRTK
jgi:hypothetical protein